MRRGLTLLLSVALGSSCTRGLPPDDFAGVAALALQAANTGNILVTSLAGSLYETGTTGATAGFYVSLRTQPSSDVIIGPISVSSTTEVSMLDSSSGAVIGSKTLTFTQTNYATPQLIALKGNQDFIVDGDKNLTVSFGSVTTQDALYARETVPSMSITNQDRDKYIYITAAIYAGNFNDASGGIAAADKACNTDANKPSTPANATYKAILADSSASTACNGGPCRRASVTANTGDGQIDWALKPLHIYYRAPPAVLVPIMVTDSKGLFIFGGGLHPACGGLTLFTSPDAAAGPNYWTGLQCDWISRPNGDTCTGWTNGAAGGGMFATRNVSTQNAISANANNICSALNSILCAQQ